MRHGVRGAVMITVLVTASSAEGQLPPEEQETAAGALGRVGVELLVGGTFATAGFFTAIPLGELLCDGLGCDSPSDDGSDLRVRIGLALLLANALYPAGVYFGGRLAGGRGEPWPTYVSTVAVVAVGTVGMLIDTTLGLGLLLAGTIIDLLGAIIGFEASHASHRARRPGVVAGVAPTTDGRGGLVGVGGAF